MTDGPVDVSSIDEHVLAVSGSIADQYSVHDALSVASHRAGESDAVVSKDAAFDGLETVWE